MNGSLRRLVLFAGATLVAALAVGVATAGAHGGPGRGGPGKASVGALVTEAAKQLGVTRAALVAAIEKAAVARIDEAVEDGDVDADDAADLKERAQDELRFALAISTTRAVASNLGITAAKLNSGFRAARKALIVKRIDAALAAGDIDAEEAAELKAELEQRTLPGYKPGGFGPGSGPGHHRGGRG